MGDADAVGVQGMEGMEEIEGTGYKIWGMGCSTPTHTQLNLNATTKKEQTAKA